MDQNYSKYHYFFFKVDICIKYNMRSKKFVKKSKKFITPTEEKYHFSLAHISFEPV